MRNRRPSLWKLISVHLVQLLLLFYLYRIFFLQPTQAAWRVVFITSACVYIVCCSVYIMFGEGTRQPWDNPSNDHLNSKQHKKKQKDIEDTAQWITATWPGLYVSKIKLSSLSNSFPNITELLLFTTVGDLDLDGKYVLLAVYVWLCRFKKMQARLWIGLNKKNGIILRTSLLIYIYVYTHFI